MAAEHFGALGAFNRFDNSAFDDEAAASSGATLTRADLAKVVQDAVGVSRAEGATFVEQVLEEIFERLVSREDVKLSSFGNFTVRQKRERAGRNPKTGEQAKITARLVVVFKPSNVMRSRIEGRPKRSRKVRGKAVTSSSTT